MRYCSPRAAVVLVAARGQLRTAGLSSGDRADSVFVGEPEKESNSAETSGAGGLRNCSNTPRGHVA